MSMGLGMGRMGKGGEQPRSEEHRQRGAPKGHTSSQTCEEHPRATPAVRPHQQRGMRDVHVHGSA